MTCDKRFITQEKLKEHISLVHDQIKPYSCSICGKSFLLQHKLKEHSILVVHEKLKLFQCSVCNYRTGLKENMTNLIDKVHGGSDIEIIYLRNENQKCYNCHFITG